MPLSGALLRIWWVADRCLPSGTKYRSATLQTQVRVDATLERNDSRRALSVRSRFRVRAGGADVPCGRAKVMAPRAERVGIFLWRTLEGSAAARLANGITPRILLTKKSPESERRDGLTTSHVGPIPKWKLLWTFREGIGLRTWRG